MATIREVARLSGVSIATVSNVLNSRPAKVSPDTRERVLAAVRKLHYKPTPLELSQKSIRTRNLAFVCEDLSPSPLHLNEYFGRTFDGVLEAAALQKWSVTVFVERMWSNTGCVVRRNYDGRCDGVIMLAPRKNNELMLNLVERGVPVVAIGTTVDLTGVSSVDIDNEHATLELTQYLLQLGHFSIAYFGPTWDVTSSEERCTGYLLAMRDASLAANVQVYLSPTSLDALAPEVEQPWNHQEFREVVADVDGLVHLAFKDRTRPMRPAPTAVVCWNESFARQLITSLESYGLSVPEDVSVATFDDSQLATSARPHLTTMRQPFHQIGRRAVDLLIARIIDPALRDTNVRFKADVVVRESTCSLSGQTGPPSTCSMKTFLYQWR